MLETLRQSDLIRFFEDVTMSDDKNSTWWLTLAVVKGVRWGIVGAWMDYDNDGNWQAYVKIASQPTNSMMQEYDIDWLMPTDEVTGEVDDTELSLGIEPNFKNFLDASDWFIQHWERFKKLYVYPVEKEVAA